MKSKNKCLLCCLLFITTIFICFGVFVYLSFRGGSQPFNPTDIWILQDGMSNSWCKGETISSLAFFNASVVDQVPQIDPNRRIKETVKNDHVPLTVQEPRKFWRYRLPEGAKIDVTQCSGSPRDVMSFIFRGYNVEDNCVRFVSEFWTTPLHKGHNPCTDITLQRFIVRQCRNSMQPMHALITHEDYYLVLYQSSSTEDTYISANITLDMPTYDLSKSLQNCSSVKSCSLPLGFASDDTVVAMLSDIAGSSPVTVTWTCDARFYLYGIVFIAIPWLFFFFCCLICRVCCCRSSKIKETPCTKVSVEPPTTAVETEPLLGPTRTRQSLDPTDQVDFIKDPRLRDMGPIPGPYGATASTSTAPSAPPKSDQPFDEPFLQAMQYPEPPPTYDQAMQEVQQENDVDGRNCGKE